MLDDLDRSQPDDERILEENIRRLIERADRPVEPGDMARARWSRALAEAQDRAVAAREADRATSRLAWKVAAAAVVVIGLAFFIGNALEKAGSDRSGRGSGPFFASSSAPFEKRTVVARGTSAGDWTEVEVDLELVLRGEAVRSRTAEVRLDDLSGRLLEVEGGTAALTDHGLAVSARRAIWEVAPDVRGRVHAPGIVLTATEATVRIEATAVAGETLPDPWEGIPMNGKVIGAGLGVAALVTVVVLMSGDEPIELEHGGTKTELTTGDVATVDGSGSVTVRRGGEIASTTERENAARSFEESTPAEPTETLDTIEVLFRVTDRDGRAVPGAAVAVHEGVADPTDPPLAEGELDPRRRASTDENGEATIALPATWEGWSAIATAARFGEETITWVDPIAPAPTEEGEQSGDVAETPEGEPLLPEGPHAIVLPYETSIAGTVIDGVTGLPIVGALTAVQFDSGPTGWSEPQVETFEEEDGSFYFGGLRPGTYWVWSYHAGFARSARLTVGVTATERTVCDPIVLSPGLDVAVTVYEEETGRPVDGAVVYPHLEHLPGTVDFPHRGRFIDERIRNAGRTGKNGRVVVRDLPAGEVLLRVLHDEYRIRDETVEGRAGEEVAVRIPVDTGPSIRGAVIDADGNEITGSEVFAVTMTMEREKAEVLAGEIVDGEYEIPHVNPGQYVVVFNGVAGDGSDVKMQFAQVDSTKDTVVDFVEFAELGTLRGTIVDSEGAPFARKFVTVTTLDENGEVTFRSGTTDADGVFEIRNLTFQEWAVAVSQSPESMVTIGAVSIEQAIDYEETFTVPVGRVEGTIVDGDGVPATQIEVFLFELLTREDGTVTQVWRGRSEVLEAGRFSFHGLATGRFQVFAQGNGMRQTFSAPFEIEEAKIAKVSMTIERGGTVRVLVRDRLGAPAVDLGVRIRNAAGVPINEGLPARSDENGFYEFTSLGEGMYTVEVFDPTGVIGGPESFEAEIGAQTEVEVRLN